ncbi:MAG: hypothetical protein IJS68_01935 [Clostridia bacterium]|nr:hypothetical protein [Clostridia bacterium]
MNRSAKDDDYVDYSNITQLLEETILEPGKDYTDLYESQYYQSQIVSYVNFFRNRWMTVGDARELLKSAKRATILLNESIGKVRISHINETLHKYKGDTIERLSGIFGDFFDGYLNTKYGSYTIGERKLKTTTRLTEFMTEIIKKVEIIFDKSNKSIERFTDEKLDYLTRFAMLYRTLAQELPTPRPNMETKEMERPADTLVAKLVENKFFEDLDFRLAKDIVKALRSSELLGEDALTKEELDKLLNKTQSVLIASSDEKIQVCRDVVVEYHDYLMNLVQDDNKFKDMVNKNVTFKNLISKAGILLNVPVETQKATAMLVKGATIGDFISKFPEFKVGKDEYEMRRIKDFKLNLTPYDLYEMLTSQTSETFQHITPRGIVAIADNYSKIIDEVFKDAPQTARMNRADFPQGEFLNNKNLLFMLRQSSANVKMSSRVKNIASNIRSLAMVMDGKQIFKIMQNNMAILYEDNAVLSGLIKDAIKAADGNNAVLSTRINEIVNTVPTFEESKTKRTGKVKDVVQGGATATTKKAKKEDVVERENPEFKVDARLPKLAKVRAPKTGFEKSMAEVSVQDLFIALEENRKAMLSEANKAYSDNSFGKSSFGRQSEILSRIEYIVERLRCEVQNMVVFGEYHEAMRVNAVLDKRLEEFKDIEELFETNKQRVNRQYPPAKRGKANTAKPKMMEMVDRIARMVEKESASLSQGEKETLQTYVEAMKNDAIEQQKAEGAKKHEVDKEYFSHQSMFEYFAGLQNRLHKLTINVEDEQTK